MTGVVDQIIPWAEQPPEELAAPSARLQDLGMCALFDVRAGRELITGLLASTVGPGRVAAVNGVAPDFASSGQAYPHHPNFALTGPLTIFVYFDIDTLSGYGPLISKQATTTTHCPYELRLGFTSSTDAQVAIIRAGSSTFSTRSMYAGNAVTAGQKGVRFITSITTSTVDSNGNAWANGPALQPFSGGGGAAVTDNGSSSVWIGRRFDGATQFDGRIYFVALFNRALNEDEIRELDANPWLVYEPLRQPAVLPAAGGSVEFLVTSTGGITLAGSAAVTSTAQYVATGTGGINLAGAGTTVYTGAYAADATGGLSFAGSATVVQSSSYAVVASGGFSLGGSAVVALTALYSAIAAGGLSFAGAAGATSTSGYSAVGAGGLAYGGSAAANAGSAYEAIASGGITLDGSGLVSSTAQHAAAGAGGLTWGGTASSTGTGTFAYEPTGGFALQGSAGQTYDGAFEVAGSGGIFFGGQATAQLDDGSTPITPSKRRKVVMPLLRREAVQPPLLRTVDAYPEA